jgi:hypothetical protein
MQEPVVCEFDQELITCQMAAGDRFVESLHFKALTLNPPEVEGDPSQDIGVLRELLQSELGWLFFDRTRIRPGGFAVGENVFSLSLAPGEEVVLEQRTFSKRETTFEEQTEQERQLDLELSSTLSTELAEGVERENNRSSQSGFQIGGSLGGNFKGLQVNASAGYSSSVSEASTLTRKRSVKDSATSSSKVASKYRAQHKTTFKVSTEDRFEQGSKRVIRNPNSYTPIDLHYFKILRRLELEQQRYAVRLCWAPVIADPAADLLKRIEIGRQGIIQRIMSAVEIPPRPEEPPLPNKPTRTEQSDVKAADKWGLSGDMRADYELAIPIPQGYVWNGDVGEVSRLSEVWGRPPDNMGWNIAGIPTPDDGNLIVRIHVGARSWIGGPGIDMQARARFVPLPPADDPEYQAKYREWQAKVAEWEADRALRLEGPSKEAQVEADEWERAMIAALDPTLELMARIAKERFLSSMTDEGWEVEFWENVFDWRRAGVMLFPGWWSKNPSRDPLKASDDFLNASWAKLYLPVAPGFERLALRWIIGKVRDEPPDPASEEAFAKIAAELAAYREQSFGDATETNLGGKNEDALQEQVLVLASWNELLPTDGTHVEVVQSMTSAADEFTRTEIEDVRKARSARVSGEEQDVELKKKAIAQFGNKPPNVDVRIATEPGEPNGR